MEIKEPTDVNELIDFVNALRQEESNKYVCLYYYDKEHLEDLLQDPEFNLLASYDDEGKIVALTRVKNVKHNYGINHYAEFTVAVHPNYQKQGLGTKIFEEHLKRLSHIKTIMCQIVDDHQEGISFFEKLGFKRYGTDPKKVKLDDGKYHDFHRYFLLRNFE